MKRVHNRLLTDEELRPELEARDVISFECERLSWQRIERQVERLGFGECYIVSAAQKSAGQISHINLRPERS